MRFLNHLSIIVLISSSSYALNVDKHLELSYVETSGNTNTTTFSSKLEGTTAFNDTESLKAKGSILYSENEKNTSANKYNIELDYNHMINQKLYSYVGINYIKEVNQHIKFPLIEWLSFCLNICQKNMMKS